MDERADYIKSAVTWRNVLDNRVQLLGREDPVTLETATFLAVNLSSQGRDDESEEIKRQFNLANDKVSSL